MNQIIGMGKCPLCIPNEDRDKCPFVGFETLESKVLPGRRSPRVRICNHPALAGKKCPSDGIEKYL